MVSAPGGTLFPTMVVGSLPRPQWIRDLIEDRKSGHITKADAGALLDDAVPLAIRMQERAGLDFLSDGEWRREHYARIFTEAVDGFEPDLVPKAGSRVSERLAAPSGQYEPAVVSRLDPQRPIAAAEAEFLRNQTSAKIIVALPSPYTVARRMWSAEHSTSAYPTREDFMEAIIPIIRREIQELVRLGVDAIQLDNPWPPVVVDPHYRQSSAPPASSWASTQEGIAEDLDREAELCVKCVNGATEGIEDVFLSVHVCHTRGHTTRGSYDVIMGVLDQMNVQRFALEFATPDAGVTDVLRDFPEDKVLGLGVIHPFGKNVETPEEVAGLVERAMEFVPKERITLNPNCGFAPGIASSPNFDQAYLKLRAMCQGARLLRERHG